jgi:molybdate transport system ATP-binding protein
MSFEIDIEKRLGDTQVSLKLEAGAGATVLFGPSGVGKSSVLNMVAGLLRPDRGRIAVDGETLFGDGLDVPPERRKAGYVFQEARLFPHMRVRANLLYGVRGEAERFEDIIGFLGIGHLLDRWPRTLSGGEAQRVAIGRCSANRASCCSTNRCRRSTVRAARRSCWRSSMSATFSSFRS